MGRRVMTPDEREFEARVLELFRSGRRGKITSGIAYHGHSGKDLAAGAGAEDRRDAVAAELQHLEPKGAA